MCPTCDGDVPAMPNGPNTATSTTGTAAPAQTNGNLTNGVDGHNDDDHTPHNPTRQPMYLQDYLSNVSNFQVGAHCEGRDQRAKS